MRPVVPGIGRVVRGEPFELGDYLIPPGVEINPSIAVTHRRGDRYPAPLEFRPERFLGDDAPDTYTWIPFGGGTRRCLGASFALQEMRVVTRRILARTELVAGRPAARAHAAARHHPGAPQRRARDSARARGGRAGHVIRDAGHDSQAGMDRAHPLDGAGFSRRMLIELGVVWRARQAAATASSTPERRLNLRSYSRTSLAVPRSAPPSAVEICSGSRVS